MKKQIIILPVILIAIVAVSVVVTAVLSMKSYPNPGTFHLQASTPLAAGNPIQPAASTEIPVDNQPQANHCTDTYTYWKGHPEKWPAQVQMGGKSINRNDAARLLQAPSTDPIQDLERVLYVTQLNISSGADPAYIQFTIDNANTWLAENQSGAPMSDFNHSVADAYKQTLEDYNNGIIGPGLCPNQPATPSPAPKLQGAAGITPNATSGVISTGKMMSYTAQPCDSLGYIALLFHVKIVSLLAANPNITSPNFIFSGEQLNIPAPDLSGKQNIWTGYDFNAYPAHNANAAGLPATGVQSSGAGSGSTAVISTSLPPNADSNPDASPQLAVQSHCPATPQASPIPQLTTSPQSTPSPIPTVTPTSLPPTADPQPTAKPQPTATPSAPAPLHTNTPNRPPAQTPTPLSGDDQ